MQQTATKFHLSQRVKNDCHRIYCHETQKIFHAIIAQAPVKISPRSHKRYGKYSVKFIFPSVPYIVMTPILRKLTTVQKRHLNNSHTEFHKNTKNSLATCTSHGQTAGWMD